MDFREKKYVSNPKETANPISKLFFWWALPILRKGAKQDLVLDDVYNCLKEDGSERLGNDLHAAWEKEKSVSKLKSRKPKLYKAMWSVFGTPYLLVGIFIAFNELIVRVAQNLLLKYLIESFAEDKQNEDNHKLHQYLYAGGVCLTTLLVTIMNHPIMYAQQHIGMKCRIAASTLIYRKALRLKRGQGSIGQLINLLSNDVNRFDINLMMLHYFYIGPLQTGIFVYFLWQEFGVSCLAGTGFVFVLMPVQYYIGKMFSLLRFKIAKKTDERGRIMNEIIIAIRVIKMYAWERPFSDLINLARKLEVGVLRRVAFYRALYLSLFIASSKVIIFLTFFTYIMTSEDNILTAKKVFFAVSIFNTMRQTMISFVPTAFAARAEIFVAISRIETFLLEEEQSISTNLRLKNMGGSIMSIKKDAKNPKILVEMQDVSASWTPDKKTLEDINLKLEGDKIVIICGPVGSGKTSLLHTLIAELPLERGSCLVQGKTTYAIQEPWIFSGNIRQNILFGHEYEEERYREIVTACALEDDFKQLAFGENTIVGERGVSLSGGQKARINLARALYSPSDIYLLDDPLSAVDSRVSRHIFEKCVKNYLKGHLRILVTHQLQYLPQADHVIVFNEGKILAQGTYKELVERGIDFVSLMATETDEDAASRRESLAPKIDPKTLKAEEEKASDKKPEDQAEKMAVGAVDASLYWKYFKSGGSYFSIFLIVFGFLLSQFFYNTSDIWLTRWTSEEDKRAADKPEFPAYEKGTIQQDTYMYVYCGLTLGVFGVTTLRALYFFSYAMKISINVHDKMFKSLVRAPTKFFDDNPSGRIMNRFTKDLGSMDELLPSAFFDFMSIFLLMFGIIILIIIQNYYMAIPTVFIIIAFALMRRFYIRTARDVKRIESVARSPLFTHLAASLQGLTTIRSSKAQKILIHQFDGHQDLHSAAWYIFIGSNRWFALWLELISVFFLFFVTFGFLLIAGDTEGGSVGLAITSALTLTGVLQWGMRQSAETENLMTSVERALEYSTLESEAELESNTTSKPDKDWPQEGKIEFNDVSLAYEEKFVLKNLSFGVKGSEKIGIVGRTGAGKSSMISALFRMTEPRGEIRIDGINIAHIGLHDLRKNISIIPQDPVLFSGTVRYNLDPFNQFKDMELWQVLEEVDLKDGISTLDDKVTDSGGNFSVGQRQLVCLARAILRKNKIIVMDEATANVDPRTDGFIQKTIRQKFADCTIITIAHRLNSVMDCDRILVLSDGCIKEYDHPHILLQNPDGALTSMIRHTGKASSDILRRVAEEKYSGRGDGE